MRLTGCRCAEAQQCVFYKLSVPLYRRVTECLTVTLVVQDCWQRSIGGICHRLLSSTHN